MDPGMVPQHSQVTANMEAERRRQEKTVTLRKALVYLALVLISVVIILLLIVPLAVYFDMRNKDNNTQEKLNSTISDLSDQNPPYRLPRYVVPIKYYVNIKSYIPSVNRTVSYDPDLNFTFDGNVTIILKCQKSTDTIILNAKNLNITASTVQLFEIAQLQKETIVRSIPVDTDYIEALKNEQLKIPIMEQLEKGKFYMLSIFYRGEHGKDLSGFYRSSYVEQGVTRWAVVTQFQATSARKALPCFDEPDLKASFVVSLTHPISMYALSNMIEHRRDEFSTNWATTYFQQSPNMSSYVLAFFISEFLYLSSNTSKGGVTFRVWARPSQIKYAEYAVKVGPRILEFFEKYFNIPFPLKKQDMIALPDFDAGAMENWGLITYREIYLLWSPKTSMAAYRQRVAEVIAHELAHQWFGNLVTMAWWDDIWLNEGFAAYMQYLGADELENGSFGMKEQFVTAAIQLSMEMDHLGSSHPLHVQVTNPQDIFQVFDHISYEKGASVLSMLRNVVGEKTFRTSLNVYLNRYKYSNANNKDLWNALTEVVKKDSTIIDWGGRPLNVSTFMSYWTEQMSYPLLTVERQYQAHTATVAQSRFKLYEEMPDNPKFASNHMGYFWYVPVWYQRSGDSSVDMKWLTPSNTLKIVTRPNRTATPSWLLVNPGVRGYYRVNYDLANWQLITTQLQTRHEAIDVRSRAQLIDDAFVLAKAGKLPYNVSLQLTSYLAAENHSLPWVPAMINFAFLKDMFENTPNVTLLKKYVSKLAEPIFHRIGIDRRTDAETDVAKNKMRMVAWGLTCEMDLPLCLRATKALFDEYKATCNRYHTSSSDCNKVPPTLRYLVYCQGIAQGTPDDWEFLWHKYIQEDVAWEKSNIMSGLTCSKDENILQKLLNKALTGSDIRMSEVGLVFINVAKGMTGSRILWQYVKERWSELMTKFDGTYTLSAVVRGATANFNTEKQLLLLQRFLQENGDSLGTTKSIFEQQLEQAQTNVEWKRRNENQVMTWLENHMDSM